MNTLESSAYRFSLSLKDFDLTARTNHHTVKMTPALQMNGTYEGSLNGRFEGLLQGELAATPAQFDRLFIQDTVIKNEGLHTGAIVPAQRLDYATNEIVSSFANLHQPASYHHGMYGGDELVSVAQRLVFDEAISYRHSSINWMGLLSHVVNFADRNIDGGDPTAVVNRETLRTILQNGLRASLGDPDALDFFDDSDNKLYCAEFICLALNTPLFPFNLKGFSTLLEGDNTTAAAILKHQQRYTNNRISILLHWV